MSIRSALCACAIQVLVIVVSCPGALGETGKTLRPLSASLDQILTTAPSQWRSPSQETFRWEMFPDIIILDTIDFSVQDRMFTRLAYFLEKRGFRGRLLGNAQLAGRHGWNAHDYGPDGLASFFNAAEDARFPLNTEEVALRTLAMEQGILSMDGGHLQPGRGGILGLSRSSSPIERRYLLTHESFHGIFFSSREYRDFCFQVWDSLAPGERDFYRSFLDSLGYDSADEFLAVNEFQAYLMQQPLEYASAYFERFIKLLSQNGARGTIDPARLVASARSLDGFLQSRFGINAGGTLRMGADAGMAR
jgi:hypothetical protein